MNRNKQFQRVDTLIHNEMEENTFPGAVLLIHHKGETVKHSAYGKSMETPKKKPMHKDTIFDLASLTKVISTTTLAMQLIEEGQWRLHDSIGTYLEEMEDSDITLHHLLTHTSGLPAWVDLFSHSESKQDALERVFTKDWPVSTSILPPGERIVYSDLGYIILGQAIERVTQTPLDDLVQEKIFTPLTMKDTCYNPPEALKDRIAATERDKTRGGILVGEVHDENAWILDGVSGHAGLFSTAKDLGKFAQMLLQYGQFNDTRVMAKPTVKKMTQLHTKGMNARRGLGWKLQGKHTPSAGDLLSTEAYGHTGFTGTSLWIDPKIDLAVVLLTNRVHPTRERGANTIQDFRARFHNCIIGDLHYG